MPSRSLLEDLDGCCSALQWAVGQRVATETKMAARGDAIISKSKEKKKSDNLGCWL